MTNREIIARCVAEVQSLQAELGVHAGSEARDLLYLDGIANRMTAQLATIRYRVTQLLDGKE